MTEKEKVMEYFDDTYQDIRREIYKYNKDVYNETGYEYQNNFR